MNTINPFNHGFIDYMFRSYDNRVMFDYGTHCFYENTLAGGVPEYEENYYVEDVFVTPASSALAWFNFENDIGNVNDLNDFGYFVRESYCLEEPTDISSISTAPSGPDDDVYMSCRRDAFKAEESAVEYSNYAKVAHARGYHECAHQFSRLEEQERNRAKKLHKQAANDILAIKNRKFDQYILDLHGLHQTEAVNALRDRLQAIESSLEKSSHDRGTGLRAIVGRGNHSKGKPVLPRAVRKFLKENGYQFDDSKPGSFLIWPKCCYLEELL